MTTIPPPINPTLPQVLAAALGPNGPSGPTATITNPPPLLAALPPGATLTGTVTAGPNPQTVVLATPSGDMQLRTPVPLPQGAELTVEVTRASQTQVAVRLVSLDGQALQQALAQSTKQPLPETPTPAQPPLLQGALPTAPGTPVPLPIGQAWWPSGPQPLTALPQISATVIANATTPTSSSGENPAAILVSQLKPLLIAGTELSLRVTSVVVPNAATATSATPTTSPLSTASAPQTSALTAPTPAAPGAVATPSSSSAGQPGALTQPQLLPSAAPATAAAATTTPLNAPPAPALSPGVPPPVLDVPATPTTAPTTSATEPLRLLPETQTLVLPNREGWPPTPPTPPTSVIPAAPQAIVTGTVVMSLDGTPVVQTPDGQIQLNVRANLPPGTIVTLEVTARQAPSALMTPPAPLPTAATLPLAGANTGWPTLLAAVETLQRSDPAVAAQFANIMPDGGARSAVAMMSLVQALRSGEPRQWPGDGNLRALERAGPRGAHLANQLAGEVSELSRQVRETPGEWRALPLPWQSDGRVERVRLIVRETDGDEEAKKKKGGGGTRFLLDLDLSRLGPLQLDGMFKKESRSFEMMVRTHAPLPENMRTDLAGLFANANAAMNLVGSLSFQVVKKFPNPLAGPSPGGDKPGLWA